MLIARDHVLDAVAIKAEVVTEYTARPDRIGHGVGAESDPSAGELRGRRDPRASIVEELVVVETTGDKDREWREPDTECLGLDCGRYSELAYVVFETTRHLSERGENRRQRDEVEFDGARCDRSIDECRGVRVAREGNVEASCHFSQLSLRRASRGASTSCRFVVTMPLPSFQS